MSKIIFLLIIGFLSQTTGLVGQPVYIVKNKVEDMFVPAGYYNSMQNGYLGERMKINAEKRLLQIDLESILIPYKHRPGVQAWTHASEVFLYLLKIK